MMTEEQRVRFQREREIDFSYSASGIGRFRTNVFYQRNSISLAMRPVPFNIPEFSTLNLPEIVRELALTPRGFILTTGATGSGKSTTLASMIDYINTMRRCHIITIEDPVEFLHRDIESIINQREVESDTASFAVALRHVVRQNPDVIMIGELRDRASLDACLHAAETGHLVLSTMHTIDAAQTLDRIINFYPPHHHNFIRNMLSQVLRGIISLRLLPRADGKGRVPAVEVMIVTPHISKLIEEGKIAQIHSAIQEGSYYGMQTFNQSLIELYRKGLVTYQDALAASTSPEEFRLAVRGILGSTDQAAEFQEGDYY
jgi:twitching motility protein PilT